MRVVGKSVLVEAFRVGRLIPRFFLVEPDLKRRFEEVCRVLGLREYEVLGRLISEFVEKNEPAEIRVASVTVVAREVRFPVEQGTPRERS